MNKRHYSSKKLRNKLEKDQLKKIEIMRELIKYDISRGAFKFSKATVNIKHENGAYTTTNINENQIVEYILMTTGNVDEVIPIDYKDELLDKENEGFNRKFHNRISQIRRDYRDKAEKEMNNIDSRKASKYSYWTLIVSIITLLITSISIIK